MFTKGITLFSPTFVVCMHCIQTLWTWTYSGPVHVEEYCFKENPVFYLIANNFITESNKPLPQCVITTLKHVSGISHIVNPGYVGKKL